MYIQLCPINVIPLLSKTYVNWVTLTEHNLSSKFCQSLEQKLCLQTGQDLFKEVLWISVGQWAANLQSVKLSWMVQSSRTQIWAARVWLQIFYRITFSCNKSRISQTLLLPRPNFVQFSKFLFMLKVYKVCQNQLAQLHPVHTSLCRPSLQKVKNREMKS